MSSIPAPLVLCNLTFDGTDYQGMLSAESNEDRKIVLVISRTGDLPLIKISIDSLEEAEGIGKQISQLASALKKG